MVSLAFSIYNNKGAYALLIGSGVSRSAGIMTGWEVVLDLIKQLAKAENEKCDADREKWFANKYKYEPDYSKILELISKTPTERKQLLKSYFEPDDEDGINGKKQPKEAHRAIAEMMKKGFIHLILTTNFDHLLEDAIKAAGISPIIISTDDALNGAPPLTRSEPMIVKLHGDYLDSRIKNTTRELSRYSRKMNTFLDRVFDEFGLIICGWSAKWDTALRNALERCKTHRYWTYWTVRGKIEVESQNLIKLRKANKIKIKDADSFFSELLEKVEALESLSKPHPLSAAIAAETMKKYIESNKIIRIHDLVMSETDKIYTELIDYPYPNKGFEPIDQDMKTFVGKFNSLGEILLSLISIGCYWGDKTLSEIWVKCLERLINLPDAKSSSHQWSVFRFYPAILMVYAGGIASLYAK
jgi:hypothetical protein